MTKRQRTDDDSDQAPAKEIYLVTEAVIQGGKMSEGSMQSRAFHTEAEAREYMKECAKHLFCENTGADSDEEPEDGDSGEGYPKYWREEKNAIYFGNEVNTDDSVDYTCHDVIKIEKVSIGSWQKMI